MPRLARLDAPGVLHHVIIRGIECRNIIRDNQNKDQFIGRLAVLLPEAQKSHLAYFRRAIDQGRRPELVGDGLVRSLGGWTEVKKLRIKGHDRIKSDERILGQSEFVNAILSEAQEELNRRYEPKIQGFDLKKIGNRVSVLLGVKEELIYARGRRKEQVQARDLYCYLAVEELGMSRTEVARQLSMSQPAVGYAVDRGRKVAKELQISLLK